MSFESEQSEESERVRAWEKIAVEMFHDKAASIFRDAIAKAKAGEMSDLRLFFECLPAPRIGSAIACGRPLFPTMDVGASIAILDAFYGRSLSAAGLKEYSEYLQKVTLAVRNHRSGDA